MEKEPRMKGFINKVVALVCCGAASASIGCLPDRWIDPCWPMRYDYMAWQSVNASMAPQVQNGHVLEQTVWNYYFLPGTDELTAGGLERLAYLARRRPCPDGVLYLQTAQDVVYDRNVPEKMVSDRQTLDGNRIAAVQAYLTAQTAGRPAPFQVVVHDPAEPSMAGTAANNIISQNYYRYMGGNFTAGGMGMGGVGMGSLGMGGGMGRGGGVIGASMGSTGGGNVAATLPAAAAPAPAL
jgi:hypothetical protein